MRILVTGGLGYIGSVTTHLLLKNGYEVTILDDLSTSYQTGKSSDVTLVRGSLLDVDSVNDALTGVDVVMHFAAKSLVGESEREPELYQKVNVEGSKLLFDTMEKKGINKVILSSTAAVYGDPKLAKIDELAPTNPTNKYGQTKLQVEKDLEKRNFASIALRYFNVAGSHWTGSKWLSENHNPETHLIPNIISANKQQPITVFGIDWNTPDGSAIRDYIHVEDLAEAHIRAINHLEKTGLEIINLGGGRGYSVLEVINTANQILDQSVQVQYSDRRPGDPAVLVASIEKAANLLNWAPKKNLSDMIHDTEQAQRNK